MILKSVPYEIRANYDKDTIVVYQAYAASIGIPAVRAQRFVAPFSFRRMTWIKPSFLWLMHRSNWGQKDNQQVTLAVRIKRTGWDKALSLGVLTHPEPVANISRTVWETQFENARVHIQWDTERSLRGAGLNHYSIQVGISRHLIREFVDDWIVGIENVSDKVTKIRGYLKAGNERAAKRLLPTESVYAIAKPVALQRPGWAAVGVST